MGNERLGMASPDCACARVHVPWDAAAAAVAARGDGRARPPAADPALRWRSPATARRPDIEDSAMCVPRSVEWWRGSVIAALLLEYHA